MSVAQFRGSNSQIALALVMREFDLAPIPPGRRRMKGYREIPPWHVLAFRRPPEKRPAAVRSFEHRRKKWAAQPIRGTKQAGNGRRERTRRER